jgi:hypothetical protein
MCIDRDFKDKLDSREKRKLQDIDPADFEFLQYMIYEIKQRLQVPGDGQTNVIFSVFVRGQSIDTINLAELTFQKIIRYIWIAGQESAFELCFQRHGSINREARVRI